MHRVLAILLTLLGWTVPASAFDPVQCTACGSGWTDKGWLYVSNPNNDPMANAAPSLQSTDGLSMAGSNYQDRLDHRRLFVGNRYSRGLRLFHNEFMTEQLFDFMEISHTESSPSSITLTGPDDTYSSSASDTWVQLPSPGSPRLSTIPAMIRFNSDGSVASSGFRFTQAGVCCSSTLAPVMSATVALGTRYTGILLATNDVVYFRVGAPSSGRALHLTLWSSYAGVDFDIKARCNILPTSATYDHLAIATGRWEYLRIPYAASCAGGSWYVAVYSASGAGGFNFVASRGQTSQEKTLRVGIEKNATAEELDQIESTLRNGARWYYGMTEGQHLVQQMNLYNNRGSGCSSCGGQSCHICFEDDNNGLISRVSNQCQSSAKMFIIANDWGIPAILAHEFGHFLGCLPDEYCRDSDVPGDCSPDELCNWCGHSMMSFHDNNLCRDADHNLDAGDQCVTASPNSASNWSTIGNVEFIPVTTPDNFNYLNHTFSANAILVTRL